MPPTAGSSPQPWYRIDAGAGALTLELHVQPGASRTRVVGVHGEALKVQLKAPPVDGKANAALAEFLADWFDVPVRDVTLVRGATSRRKTMRVAGSRRDPAGLLPESA